MLPLVVDGVIASLLLIALGLGWRLQRSLRRLRCDDNEIKRLIETLDAVTQRSAGALDGLRQTAEATGQRLAGDLASAQRLLDELNFLASRGDQLAARLEEQIHKGRPTAARAPVVAVATPPAAAARSADRTADLERALRTLR